MNVFLDLITDVTTTLSRIKCLLEMNEQTLNQSFKPILSIVPLFSWAFTIRRVSSLIIYVTFRIFHPASVADDDRCYDTSYIAGFFQTFF